MQNFNNIYANIEQNNKKIVKISKVFHSNQSILNLIVHIKQQCWFNKEVDILVDPYSVLIP